LSQNQINMENYLSPAERKYKRKGFVTSMIVHAIVIILLLLPLLSIPIPAPGPPGVLVNLGLPDVGQGDENAPAAAPAETENPQPEEAPAPQPEKPAPKKPEPQKQPSRNPEPETPKPVVRTEDPSAVAIRQQKERERQQAEEADRRAREEADKKAREEADRKAREEADRKAAADAKALKDRISSSLGGGGGKGKGETTKPGNQGDPGGDPNSEKLTGISSGIGGDARGFGDRRPTTRPSITDDFQQAGDIVLDVCVNADGVVVSARYKPGGSTSSDPKLVSIARTNAMRWKFEKGDEEEQCGTITYRFRLK
jgi:outer membrane biosynthesis protein TonB